MDNLSVADIAAVTRNNDYCNDGMGFGGGWLSWILIFALLGGGGFGFGGRAQAATTDEVAAGFANSAVLNKLNELTVGQANINQNLGNAICSSTYELASKIDNCCCNTQAAVQQVRYDMAVQNGDIKSLIHSEAEATRNLMQQNKIESLQQQINALNLQTALCGIPRTSPYGYGIYAYPACSGYNGACGNCAY